MPNCPFCGESVGPNDFVLGIGTYCPRCGKRVEDALPVEAPPPPVRTAVVDPPPIARPRQAVVVAPVSKSEAEIPDEDETPPGHVAAFYARLRGLDGATVGAFFLGSTAILCDSIPPLNFLTKALSGLGLFIGLAGSVVPALIRKTQLGFPMAMSSLCLFALLFVGSWPKAPPPPPPRFIAVSLGQAGMIANEPIGEDDWIDAKLSAVQRDDLRVTIVSVKVRAVELKRDEKSLLSRDRFLVIQVLVNHVGLDATPLPYERWADGAKSPSKNPPTLTDNLERAYPQKTFDPPLRVAVRKEQTMLMPGGGLTEVLVFPIPPVNAEYLRLTLPAAAFGAHGAFKFQIPRGMIENS